MATTKDSQIDALLVGYEDQENLGLRSIMATLLADGYTAALVPYYPGQDDKIVETVQKIQPRLVGFSVIFQYTLEEFGKLTHCLRQAGVGAHFTAGGHFPSLRPTETLELLPELDSVVRFEGELTLLELLHHLDLPGHWQDIDGLVFRRNGKSVINQPRPLIADLDSLPPVYRDEPRSAGRGLNMASMLASRGCLFNCSFCSIRQFYGGAPGSLRRTRSPQTVVDEMLTLFNEKEVRVFIFQDDDFAARTPRQREWLGAFIDALSKAGLADQIWWKISCRVDDLELESLEMMLAHGLMAVYLGVESGSQQGLHTMNKLVTVDQNLAAIDLLKRYDVALAIGFMLFDPSSTVETVRENLNFLRTVGEDGYFPINFCKMLPYAGTPIEDNLRKEGRLKGTIARPDYDFVDPRLDWYAFLVHRIFSKRNFNPSGLVAILQRIDFDYRLARAIGLPEPDGYGLALRRLISRSNNLALDTLEVLLDEVLSHKIETLIEEQETLLDIADEEWRGEAEIEADLTAIL